MRLRVEIDDHLLAQAKAASGLSRTKDVVEAALREAIDSEQRRRAAELDAIRRKARTD